MSVGLCGAVVIARDEESVIEKCLASLRVQTSKLIIVLVDDGSNDATVDVASKYTDKVVNLPRHEENWTGRPELARVFNAGFKFLKKRDVNYILISGADAFYPPNYVEYITNWMGKEKIVLASGMAEGESSYSLYPRGSGRVIDAKWFMGVGFRYPENYGFEGYLLFKALSQGRRVSVMHGLTFQQQRETRHSKRKWYLWGRGMRALNYWWPYAICRTILTTFKDPRGGFEMLRGYLSETEEYDDVRSFIPRYQAMASLRRFKGIMKTR